MLAFFTFSSAVAYVALEARLSARLQMADYGGGVRACAVLWRGAARTRLAVARRA